MDNKHAGSSFESFLKENQSTGVGSHDLEILKAMCEYYRGDGLIAMVAKVFRRVGQQTEYKDEVTANVYFRKAKELEALIEE